jgi:hypothetical protein
METSNQRSHNCSRHVVIRFGLKVAAFSVVCGFQIALGHPSLFFALTTLAAMLSVVLAVQAQELPFSRSLNYWDEALFFGFISYLGKGVLSLG